MQAAILTGPRKLEVREFANLSRRAAKYVYSFKAVECARPIWPCGKGCRGRNIPQIRALLDMKAGAMWMPWALMWQESGKAIG